MRAVRTILCAALLMSATAFAGPAHAAFHLIKIVEVFAGTPGAPDAHYVALRMYFAGQTALTDRKITVHDAGNEVVGEFTFPGPVPNGVDQSSILVGTPEAAALFGAAPDLPMTAVIPGEGGKVCFDAIDCVSWGGYSGSTTGTGTPFNAGEGIPSGAAIGRDLARGSRADALDEGDDVGDSATDFGFVTPVPINNAGATGAASGGVVAFDPVAGAREGESAVVSVTRSGGSGTAEIDYGTADGTAHSGSDYETAAGSLQFGESPQQFSVAILDDAAFEGEETVMLRLRNPGGLAVLSTPDAVLIVAASDFGVRSTIDRPAEDSTYARKRLRRFRGTASAEDGAAVEVVQVALRAKMRSGRCKWFKGIVFVARSCNRKLWRRASGTESWAFELPIRLARSRGTRIKHYTLFSRARGLDRTEVSFERGRNANRFDVR